MRKILQDATARLELLEKDESILEFKDIRAAVDYLRRFINDAAQMSILRSLIAGRVRNAHRLNSEDVLKQVASILLSGEIKILRSPQFLRRSSRHEAEEETTEQGQQAAGREPRRTSWIEIYLRDMEGQPVPGKKYKIKLPDGSVQEGVLDDWGHAEYFEINPGTCEVSFPDLDAEAWERI